MCGCYGQHWSTAKRLFVTSLCSHFNKLGVTFRSCLLSLSVFDAYEKITELSIEDSIKNELSGDFERLMLAVGKRLGESATHRTTWGIGSCLFNKLLFFLFGFSSHSPVHQERSHVLCQTSLQVNEGKHTIQSYTAQSHSVWFQTHVMLQQNSHMTRFLQWQVVIQLLKITEKNNQDICTAFSGSRYSWQHSNQDHDFPLWNWHVGHPGVFPFKIWEVTL